MVRTQRGSAGSISVGNFSIERTMACPMSGLHLVFLLLFVLFPITLSISAIQASPPHNVQQPKVMYVVPKQEQPLAQRDYKTNGLSRSIIRVIRSTAYKTVNTSNESSGDSGGGEVDIVHKTWKGPASGGPLTAVSNGWDVTYLPSEIDKLKENEEVVVTLEATFRQDEGKNYKIQVIPVEGDWVVSVYPPLLDLQPLSNTNNSLLVPAGFTKWTANFTVKGVFLGFAKLKAMLLLKEGSKVNQYTPTYFNHSSVTVLKVSVIRNNSWVDHAFTGSIAILVSVLFVNFGAALDWSVLKESLRRPIGPAIGFVTQFLFMPVVGYALAMMLFDSPSMQLGLFFTGCSPGGGASNIWTFALGGNLPLSITMTTISTFASFGMMPFWLFTLGAMIFSSAELSVPYSKIATFAVALVVPLALGFMMQRKWPKAANFMVKHVLKPLCGFLLIFIVIFAIATNLYIFHLFSWKIILSGMGLPWLGFSFGAIVARIFSLPTADILAIAIETGVQNTGIAIFMLRFTLGQPLADLTTVIPVAIAIMTPIPLFCLWVYRVATGKINLRMHCSQEESGIERPLRDVTMESVNGTMTSIDRKITHC
ncbi:ileal sodium/bile acid cotransporter-like isoform X2 [Hetaerina americana]|uniref:ileal sodium/bile acid cotransporter-like isoform X2 n=1 Tax=Hetaerina americana TaxID=62018 RepID=UPI003A7F4639